MVFGRTSNVFEEIKRGSQKPPILHFPDSKGRFHMYSDTNEFAIGRKYIYQIQNAKQILTAYASLKCLKQQEITP